MAVIARDKLYSEEAAFLAICQVCERLLVPAREALLKQADQRQTQAVAAADFEAGRREAAFTVAMRDTQKQLKRCILSRLPNDWLALIERENSLLADYVDKQELPSEPSTG